MPVPCQIPIGTMIALAVKSHQLAVCRHTTMWVTHAAIVAATSVKMENTSIAPRGGNCVMRPPLCRFALSSGAMFVLGWLWLFQTIKIALKTGPLCLFATVFVSFSACLLSFGDKPFHHSRSLLPVKRAPVQFLGRIAVVVARSVTG